MSIRPIFRIVLITVALTACSSSVLAQRTAKPGQSTGPIARQPTREEIEAENKKITAENELVQRSFNAGNEAVKSGRYDEAINAYRGGLRARPDEPSLLMNLAEALRLRGATTWNASQTPRNSEGMEAAKRDWLAAASSSLKALQVLNQRSPDPARRGFHEQDKILATTIRAQAMKLVATQVDDTQAHAAWEAWTQYVATVSDPAQKSKLKGQGLQMLLDAVDFKEAILRSREVLRTEPGHLDATRVLGMSLLYEKDEANAKIYLQRYVRKAPDSDPHKQEVQMALKIFGP